MARRRGLPEDLTPDGADMTPMIDVVFQLLIFFMITMDMSKAKIELLSLPTASKAIKEKHEDPTTLLVNIMKDGTVKIDGKTYWSPKNKDDAKKLEDLFEDRRQRKQYQEVPGKADWVKYPMLVRCDRSTPFEHLQKIMMIATHHGGVTRMQLGAKQEAK
jgi:biopolymer transport protein ExbD